MTQDRRAELPTGQNPSVPDDNPDPEVDTNPSDDHGPAASGSEPPAPAADEPDTGEPPAGDQESQAPDPSAESAGDEESQAPDPSAKSAGDQESQAPDESAESAGDEEFARLLDAAGDAAVVELKPGQKVTGAIVQIGDQEAFVDCGGRTELPIALDELRDESGDLTHQIGDEITAHVQKRGGELGLTLAIVMEHAGLETLREAAANGTPIRGKVKDINKGGLTVDVGGRRGFCPFSQIDLRRVDEPEQFLETEQQFKILELSDDGRNIVLSRRALLQEKREAVAHETRAQLQLGDVYTGHVTRLVPFGAFVDIGGVEGLVHISQISHQRVANPAEVLQEGQEVRVQVLEVQNLGQGRRERIGLSIKALAEDPWPATARSLEVGRDIEGVITRLVDFGAFVQLQPGVEGLVHISEMADRRILHPREVCNEGDEVTVRVLNVDLDRRRISLSLRQSAAWQE